MGFRGDRLPGPSGFGGSRLRLFRRCLFGLVRRLWRAAQITVTAAPALLLGVLWMGMRTDLLKVGDLLLEGGGVSAFLEFGDLLPQLEAKLADL